MANYCEHCGSELTPGSFYCQNCGAPVPQGSAAAQAEPEPSARRRVQTPRTIDELTAFCERHELPLAKMRFFIGLDYPGAKAFGIFQDSDGNFVVYKNKADGSRAVRYRGPDEAYAVNEIFQKLKEEATNQRSRVANARRSGYPGSEAQTRNPYNSADGFDAQRKEKKKRAILGVIIGVAAAITIARAAVAHVALPHHHRPANGYYNYGGNTYYSQNSDWYLYDNDGWYPISVSGELLDNAEDYYASYSYSDDYGVSDFTESDYYYYNDDYSSSDSDYDYDDDWDSSSSWDWDDDDDWDSGSDWDWDSDWDSGSTDWDSDW